MVALVDHCQQLRVVIPHLLVELSRDEAEEVEAKDDLVEPKPEVVIECEGEGQRKQEIENHGADGKEVEDIMLVVGDVLVLLKELLVGLLHFREVVK